MALALPIPLAARPSQAEWLSLLRSSMVFNEGEFDGAQNIHGGCPTAVASADFDGDGHQDLVVANRNETMPDIYGTSVSVLLHTNPSGYSPGIGFWNPIATGAIPPLQIATNYAAGMMPLNVAAGDISGDGRPDIVINNGSFMTYLFNTGLAGAARFAAPKSYACVSTFGAMHVGDVNNDGTLEVVVPYGSTAVRTYRGSADSLILVGTPPVPSNYEPFTAADATGDGLLDLILYNRAGDGDCGLDPMGELYVVAGTAQGTFGAQQGPYPFAMIAEGHNSLMITASLNGDPYPDIVAIAVCGSKLWISQGLPGGQFAAPFPLSLPHNPRTVAAGDIDSDGNVDLVTTQYQEDDKPTSSVCVIRGNGDLTFAAPVLTAGPSRALAARLLDPNEDGWLDLVTTQTGDVDWFGGSERYNHAVEVLWNDGGGTFLAPMVSQLGSHSYQQAVADFNRDGFPDVASSSSFSVDIGHGNGTGTFTPGASLSIASPTTLVAGDTNRDSRPDLLIQSGNACHQWWGHGDGTFTFAQSYALTIYPRSLHEMTRDGYLDLVAWDGTSLVVRAGSIGPFGGGMTIGTPGVGVNAVQPGDWNRDGLPDVAVAGPNGLSVYLRTGQLTFGSEAPVRPGRPYTDVCSGDFNRDGILDLAARESGTALPLTRGVDVFLGTGNGTFGAGTSYGTLDPLGFTLHSWDANLDGIPDLLASSKVNASPSASMDIFVGNGVGQFGLRTSYGLGPVDQTVAGPFVTAADIDRNGVPDIVSGRDWTGFPETVRIQTVLATPPAYTAERQDAKFFATQFAPVDLAVGDLDRDGKLDVVTASFQINPGIAVHRGNGGGAIGSATTLAQSWNASRVRLADLNRDGILDIVGANLTGAPLRVYSMLGNGNMTFGPRNDYLMNVGNDMEVGDVNLDGLPDVVVATPDSVRLLLGTGAGSFVAVGGVALGSPIHDIDLADLNRDGVLDVVCAKGNVVVLYTGPGGLGAPTPLTTPVSDCQKVCVADMNRDGFPDIVANQSDSYYVVWGAASSSFSTYQHTQLPWGTYDLQVGPMAANGIPYLMITHNVHWLEIVSVSPTGVLAPAGGYLIGTTPTAMALADMDRDALLDVVSVGADAATVAINLRGAGTITAVEATAVTPPVTRLGQNYPNPFNPRTTIRFTLPARERVRLTVHDVQGRLVTVLEDRELPAGEHSVPWRGTNDDGRGVASGVYYYRLATDGGDTQSRRMVLVK